ncbi:MAG: calcium-translocating P-type ATPase, SERCA-type [Firmicutes bacterium]|nr:calcium-translocating P-type ATPase, SERCA-type [Bacillota bacterium]
MDKDKLQETRSKEIKEILFHTISVEKTLQYLNTDLNGLTEEEALKRKSIYGSNLLEEGERKTLFLMFLEQFKNVMVLVLLVAAAISGFLKEITDTIIILAVVIINAILGVIQESKAERALEALKKMSSPYSKVKRNGNVTLLKTEEIVPGDIVLLEAGDFVPADMRLVESVNLKVEEAALTGESVPVEKFTREINDRDIVIGDRKNLVFSGSSVTYGRGMGVVTHTGMNTQVGKIAGYITKSKPDETPLQKKLAEIGKYISIGVIVVAVIIFITGMLKGREFLEMFLISVSLAVAAIPEGLPAVVTIVLAIGVQKMSKRNAIIRKLPAVETLGSTDIICSDKTGTLTQNKMTVTEVYLDGGLKFAHTVTLHDKNFNIFAQIMALCNDSRVKKKDGEEIEAIGDPTETALVNFIMSKGLNKEEMERSMPRVNEIPFDSERKLMTTINQHGERYRVLTKGAPDMLLKYCSKILINDEILPLSQSHLKEIEKANSLMAGKALRVLAMAFKDIDIIPENISSENIENDLVFVGLTGMIDPPRVEVKNAVKVCRQAGIKPIMITGDHKDTAIAIAKELGIIADNSQVITGSELDKISDDIFEDQVEKYLVYARVSPEHKVRIVKAWKKKGMIVAMTGDGVNDAPALKSADIGVGMGITGTDVSKSVSDMVLADDNFATIVTAVEEGRRIYSNIRKVIQFLLSANMGEVITLFIATMLNWTILFPIHILWINLVTDTFPALALGVEKADKDIMTRKPVKSNSSIFSGNLGVNILYQGILEGFITLAVYYIGFKKYSSSTAITMAFATLGLIQLVHSFNVRSGIKSAFNISFTSNKYLVWAFLLSAFLQISVIAVPYLNNIFRISPLNFTQWLIVATASLSIIPFVELVKLIQRHK